MPRVRVLMWCRLSREVGRSVERQEEDGYKLAEKRGWEVGQVFKEWASASEFSKKARKEWLRFLREIEGLRDEISAGQEYAVILWMEDRSTRQIIQAWEFVKVCKDVGLTRIVLPSYEYDLSDPEDEAKFMGEVLHAQREMAKMSKRIRRYQLEEAEDGQPHRAGIRKFGTVGFGKSKVSPAQAQKECLLIEEAADRVLAGDSLRGIVHDWHERGVKTAAGKPFQNTTLKQMLLAPWNAGYRSHHGKLHPGTWDPILPPEKWEAVREVLTNPMRSKNLRRPAPRYLLSGIVFCGRCNSRMYARIDYRGEKRLNSYVCLNRPELGNCGGVRRNMQKVDRLIEDALFKAVEDENEKFDAAKQTVHGDGSNNGSSNTARELYQQLARDTGLLDRLEDKVAEELIKPETAKRKRVEIERRMERTREKISQLTDSRVRTHIPLPRTLRAEWSGYSLDRKRAIILSVLHKVTIHPQGSGSHFDVDAIAPDWKV